MTDANQACAIEPKTIDADSVLLGTVALEPNRWGLLSRDRKPLLCTADWLARAEEAGFDGIELWEHHATRADASELERLRRSRLPVSILNTYVSFDDDDDGARSEVARWVARLGAVGVKFNVGNDPGSIGAYTKRLARFAEKLPEGTQLICECHAGTVADDPAVAREILSSVGAANRLRALVHLGDDLETLDAMFGALGDRIRHVHVNFLRRGAPPLAEIADHVQRRVDRIRSNGFVGSYTIEFVNGVGTDHDQPAALIEAAVRDLSVLREVLGTECRE